MQSHEVVNRFLSLFDGNHDAVGEEEGGCKRLSDSSDWELEIEGHLRYPDTPVGVYPMEAMNDDDITTLGARSGPLTWVVKWGCVDFDEGDETSWIHACNVQSVLAQLGVAAYVERSRSKGYHVWVFAATWVKAEIMRNALLAACQIAGAPTKEINPKQVELKPDQLGNYVRLPYPGAFSLADPLTKLVMPRRVMVNPMTQEPYSIQEFLSIVKTTPEEMLALVASYHIEPVRATVERDWSSLTGSAVDRLRGKARIIFDSGPLEHPDSPTGYRGHTLWKLACYLSEDGQHNPEEALELLADADQRWGKFHERPDGALRLQQMVDRAFAARGDNAALIHDPGAT